MPYLDNLLLATRPKHPTTRTRILALIIGTLFGGGGLAALISATLNPIIENNNASHWLPTPATVTSSKLTTLSDSDGNSYKINVTYNYTHKGKTHQGNRYTFDQTPTNVGVGAMKEIIKSHPPGSPLTIYINPEKPEESVASRKLPPLTYLGIPFSIPFLTVGIIAIGYALLSPYFHRRFIKLRDQILPLTEPTNTNLIHTLLNKEELPDHQELFYLPGEKPKQLLAGTFIVLFVNGIIAVFIFIMIIELLTGGIFGIFLAIFLIPFVLLGTKLLLNLNKARKISNPPDLLIAAEVHTTEDDQTQVTLQWLNLNKTTPKTLGFKTLQKSNTLKLFEKKSPLIKESFLLIPKEKLNTGTIHLPIKLAPPKRNKNHLAGASIEILYKTINHPTQTLELEIIPHSNDD